MKIPKNGIKTNGNEFNLGNFWYASVVRYNKRVFFKSHNCRFDNTCGGTEEISADEFCEAAEKHAKLFGLS